MTAPVPDKRTARANAVAFAHGQLERGCIAYVELRAHHSDHRFERELMTLCLQYGEALKMGGI